MTTTITTRRDVGICLMRQGVAATCRQDTASSQSSSSPLARLQTCLYTACWTAIAGGYRPHPRLGALAIACNDPPALGGVQLFSTLSCRQCSWAARLLSRYTVAIGSNTLGGICTLCRGIEEGSNAAASTAVPVPLSVLWRITAAAVSLQRCQGCFHKSLQLCDVAPPLLRCQHCRQMPQLNVAALPLMTGQTRPNDTVQAELAPSYTASRGCSSFPFHRSVDTPTPLLRCQCCDPDYALLPRYARQYSSSLHFAPLPRYARQCRSDSPPG